MNGYIEIILYFSLGTITGIILPFIKELPINESISRIKERRIFIKNFSLFMIKMDKIQPVFSKTDNLQERKVVFYYYMVPLYKDLLKILRYRRSTGELFLNIPSISHEIIRKLTPKFLRKWNTRLKDKSDLNFSKAERLTIIHLGQIIHDFENGSDTPIYHLFQHSNNYPDFPGNYWLNYVKKMN